MNRHKKNLKPSFKGFLYIFIVLAFLAAMLSTISKRLPATQDFYPSAPLTSAGVNPETGELFSAKNSSHSGEPSELSEQDKESVVEEEMAVIEEAVAVVEEEIADTPEPQNADNPHSEAIPTVFFDKEDISIAEMHRFSLKL
jgi:hypothetical protein